MLAVGFDEGRARTEVGRLLEQGVDFDAVVACSDVLATAAVVPVLRLHRPRLSRDVAVVGYDDIEWASHADPPLTTVRQPVAARRRRMVEALLEQVAGRDAPPPHACRSSWWCARLDALNRPLPAQGRPASA